MEPLKQLNSWGTSRGETSWQRTSNVIRVEPTVCALNQKFWIKYVLMGELRDAKQIGGFEAFWAHLKCSVLQGCPVFVRMQNFRVVFRESAYWRKALRGQSSLSKQLSARRTCKRLKSALNGRERSRCWISDTELSKWSKSTGVFSKLEIPMKRVILLSAPEHKRAYFAPALSVWKF